MLILFSAILASVVGYQDREDEPVLFPISVNGRWGYIDRKGDVIVSPRFAAAYPFREGLGVVSVIIEESTGDSPARTFDAFVDENGEFAIPPRVPKGLSDAEGVRSYQYDDFCNGLARVTIPAPNGFEGVYGYIDRQGSVVIQPRFSKAGKFCEGLAFARLDDETVGVAQSGLFVDERGQIAFSIRSVRFGFGFREGRCVVTFPQDEAVLDRYGLIDRTGKYVIEPEQYGYLSGPINGVLRVVHDGEVGLLDLDGETVVEFGLYDSIREPLEGKTFVATRDGKTFLLDAAGNVVGEVAVQGSVRKFSGGLAAISNNGKEDYIDETGQLAVPMIFDAAAPFSDGLGLVSMGKDRGYVSREGVVVWKTDRWDSDQ